MGAAGLTATVTRPVRNSFLFAPLQRRTDRVAEALEDRILSLIQTGRSQEQIGRLMAEDAVSESIESVFDYIAHNPQIRDLVQEQALGFTGEITVGTREALLTVDSAFDNLLRKIFRRKPRADLKGPPEAVMKLEQHYNYQEQGRAK